jgi:hypothetical protein
MVLPRLRRQCPATGDPGPGRLRGSPAQPLPHLDPGAERGSDRIGSRHAEPGRQALPGQPLLTVDVPCRAGGGAGALLLHRQGHRSERGGARAQGAAA